MRRKLFALAATVVMLLSMFSGIASASGNHKILLSHEAVISSNDEVDIQQITGSVVYSSGSYDNRDFQIEVTHYDGSQFVTQVFPAPNGAVNFFLLTNLTPQDVRVDAKLGNTIVASTIVKVRYNVTTDPANLNLGYGSSGSQVFVVGTVTDRRNRPVVGAEVQLFGGTQNLAQPGLRTNVSGQFGILLSNWGNVSNFDLWIAGRSHLTSKVSSIPANLTVTPRTGVVHSIASTQFTIEGSGFEPYGEVVFSLKYGNDHVSANIGRIHASSNGAITQTFSWLPKLAGTYTLEASQARHTGSTTISVVNPSGYNFVNIEQLTTLRIGDASSNQLRIGKHLGGTGAGTYLVAWDGGRMTDDFYYDVYVDGELIAVKQANAIVGVAANQFGSKQIRVAAFRDSRPSGSHNPVYTLVYEQTFIARVSGWSVALNTSSLTVNETRDITFVIKDENGYPVNNATIQFGSYAHYPYSQNIQDGTYTFKGVKFSTAGSVPVSVKQGDTEKAKLTLNITGQKVYQLTSNVSSLLHAQPQTVRLNVSKGNQALLPQALETEDTKGKITAIPFNVVSSSSAYTIIDAVITPELVGDLIVRARNLNGSECGELQLGVVAPKLELIDIQAANVTENIKTKVRFRVVDPRDNSVLNANVNVACDYANITVRDAYDSLLWNNTLLGASEHTISILATDAKYETASDQGIDVNVSLKVNGATVGSFPVKPATLVSDPSMLIIGAPTTLTLTYKDANGRPISNKAIEAREGSSYVKIGSTDTMGQVSYSLTQSSYVSFQAATDVSNKYVVTEVRAGYDTEKPKLTYSPDSQKSTATLTITDNVRLAKVLIDGEDIKLLGTNRYQHVVSLKPGMNKIHVQAYDSNYNLLDEIIEIKYEASDVPPTTGGQSVKYTLGKTTYYADGVAKQLEAAPFLRGDHTLVPVRALQSIGAIFAWDSATRTATFQLDNNVVKVTIGKSTAIVNGKATAMPLAAEIVNDRTMVPFRFVGQSLGLQVDYVAATRDIIITRK